MQYSVLLPSAFEASSRSSDGLPCSYTFGHESFGTDPSFSALLPPLLAHSLRTSEDTQLFLAPETLFGSIFVVTLPLGPVSLTQFRPVSSFRHLAPVLLAKTHSPLFIRALRQAFLSSYSPFLSSVHAYAVDRRLKGVSNDWLPESFT